MTQRKHSKPQSPRKEASQRADVSLPDDLPPSIVPKPVVSRLSLYLRQLQQLKRIGQTTVSSKELGELLGITDAQVRKDIAYFGHFGQRGVGYRCDQMIERIRSILGTDRVWPVVLVGCGHLGQALLGYRGFAEQGFTIVAALDSDRALVGKRIAGVAVQPLDAVEAVVSDRKIRLAILAVPAQAAQSVADRLVAAGITGILNFAPIVLKVRRAVRIVSVDLAIELEQLSFAAQRGRPE